MADFDQADRKRLGVIVTFERFIAILGVVLLAVSGFVAKELVDLGRSQAAMRPDILGLKEQIGVMRAQLDNLYTKQDARRDFEVRDAIDRDLSQRLRILEQREMKPR